jgi:hypothetical protein
VDIIQPTVVAHSVVRTPVGAVIAQFADNAIDLAVIGDHSASIAKSAQVLVADEALADGIA